MKIKLIIVIVLVNFAQSCCLHQGEEIDRIAFSEEAKALIPYQESQVINMIHSQGFEFTANTLINTSFSSNQEHCEDYVSYEIYGVEINSELPSLKININLRRAFIDEELPFVDISINNISFHFDETSPLDTIQINGFNFENVYRYYSESPNSEITKIFYNQSIGILKINYTNDDYVQINP